MRKGRPRVSKGRTRVRKGHTREEGAHTREQGAHTQLGNLQDRLSKQGRGTGLLYGHADRVAGSLHVGGQQRPRRRCSVGKWAFPFTIPDFHGFVSQSKC